MMKVVEKTKTPTVKFEEFFSTKEYKDRIFEVLEKYPNVRSVEIDYRDLEIFDPDLADLLIEKPDTIIRTAQRAIQNINPVGVDADLNIRFKNITNIIPLRDLRSKFIGKLVAVDGIVRKVDEIRPRILRAVFECRSCGHQQEVPQSSNILAEPSFCPECRGRSFRLLQEDSQFLDTQTLKLQEPLENLSGGEQPRQITIVLEDDLVDTLTPGDVVRVTGILRTIKDDRAKRFKNFIYGNYAEFLEQEFEELQITAEDEKKIKELAVDPNIYERIVRSTVPSIYGYREIKEAIALQLFGGTGKELDDKTRLRGDIHILIVGDPGIGKSQMLKYVSKLAPRGIYTSGKGTTGVGLCVAPESLIFTEEGALEIGDFVDKNLTEPIKYKMGVYVSKLEKPIRVQTINPTRVSSRVSDKVWRLRAPEKLVKITTETGKELTLTPETKVLSFEEGELRWREAKRLGEGDHVATTRRLEYGGRRVLTLELIEDLDDVVVYGVESLIGKLSKEIKMGEGIRESAGELGFNGDDHYRNTMNLKMLLKLAEKANYSLERLHDEIQGFSQSQERPIKLPKYLNERFLYFVGLIVGDGDIRVKSDGVYSIRFSNTNRELRRRFKSLVKELFGIESRESTLGISFNSKIIAHILGRLGIPESGGFDISEVIFSLPNKELAAFIRGLFDSGGIIRDDGPSSIEFYTKSEKLARKLQLVLLRFGIIAHLKRGEVIGDYLIRISGEGIGKFAKFIGFEDLRKKNRLQGLQGGESNTIMDIIPGIGETIEEIISFYGVSVKEAHDFGNLVEEDGAISRKSLQRIIRNLKSKASIENVKIELPDKLRSILGKSSDKSMPFNTLVQFTRRIKDKRVRKSFVRILRELKAREEIIREKLQYLESLAYSDILFEKIKRVEVIDSPYDHVYDLTVKESHSFIANGIVVHNTAAAVRDELGGWSLEAGALVLGDRGIVCVDELDKMREEDRSAIHEALEQQTISIAKAGIMATLNSRCAVLAAANPKFGRFDTYKSIAEQIDLPSTILSRFDLIFVIEDKPHEERDRELARHILKTHKEDTLPIEIEPELLRKYIAYARKNIHPKLTDEAMKVLEEFYVSMRSSATDEDSPVPITARQLEAIIRLAEASARVKLKNKVEAEDAKRAIRLAKSCLKQVGYDPETGKIDIDKVEGRTPKSERDKFNILIELIKELEEEYGGKAPTNILKSEMLDRYNISEEKVEELLRFLQEKGVIFEPQRGYVKIV